MINQIIQMLADTYDCRYKWVPFSDQKQSRGRVIANSTMARITDQIGDVIVVVIDIIVVAVLHLLLLKRGSRTDETSCLPFLYELLGYFEELFEENEGTKGIIVAV